MEIHKIVHNKYIELLNMSNGLINRNEITICIPKSLASECYFKDESTMMMSEMDKIKAMFDKSDIIFTSDIEINILEK